MPNTIATRIRSWKTVDLPSPGSRQTRVRVPICDESALYLTERHDPITGIDWTFAVVTELWINPDPRLGTTLRSLSNSVWMRQGRPTQPVSRGVLDSRADGWFEATTDQLAARSRWMHEERREEFKRLNLAKQRGLHLLRCTVCNTLSDLDARGWRLKLEDGLTLPVCPCCAPFARGASATQTS